jgi:hypothetical protein
MRVTLADLRASRVPEALNIPPTDTRFAAYVNEATERLLRKGHWWGTTAKYAISVMSGYITLPRQIATIEKVSTDHIIKPVRDQWYEFLDNGWGTREATTGTEEALFKGRYATISDVVPSDKKARIYCDLASDAGKKVLILGYDDDGNWIRTTQDGVVSDGEIIALAQSPGTYSTSKFSAITDVQAPTNLDGQWWLYSHSTVDDTESLLGNYQYDEIRPSYARYFFPALALITETPVLVEALVKLDFIPVARDTDYCLLGNIPALKRMCMAVKAEEENRFTDALALEAMAVKSLDEELAHYLGAGYTQGINIIGSSIGQNDPIPTLM